MEHTTENQPDLFDRIATCSFDALTPTEQAEFLREYELEDYVFIQQAMQESSDYFKQEFEALQVDSDVYEDLSVRANAKPEKTWAVANFLRQALNYRIPVYQICGALAMFIAGFWLFGAQSDYSNNPSTANTYIADSTFSSNSVIADTGSSRNEAGFELDIVIPVDDQEIKDDPNMDTASYTPGIDPETSEHKDYDPNFLLLDEEEVASHDYLNHSDHFSRYAASSRKYSTSATIVA